MILHKVAHNLIPLILYFLSVLYLSKAINPYMTFPINTNSETFICMQYIPPQKLLAVALKDSGILFYKIEGTSSYEYDYLPTLSQVNIMTTMLNNTKLIFA